MDQPEFLKACNKFKFSVRGKPEMPIHRYWEELIDHQRHYELSLWWGTGIDEAGVAFWAEAHTWDGTVDWDRVNEIIADKANYIRFDQHTHDRMWNLADLSKPLRPTYCRCPGADAKVLG